MVLKVIRCYNSLVPDRIRDFFDKSGSCQLSVNNHMGKVEKVWI